MTTLDLQSKYTQQHGDVFLTGVQALVRVLFDQMRIDRAEGLRTAVFASGYPGSPLGGFDRELAAQRNLFGDYQVVHAPGHNEDLAATAVMGSQAAATFPNRLVDGVLGVWYGKAPGLDRSGDAIRHAQYNGTSRHGGVLAYVGDDPACKSSSIPGASEQALRDLELPILYPGTVQEVLDLGLHGVALSRMSGLWTSVRVVTPLADGAATADVALDRVIPIIPAVEWRGAPYVPSVTGKAINPFSIELEQELYTAKVDAARQYGIANGLNRVTVDPADAQIGIVSTGHTYHEVLAALRKIGLPWDELARNGIRLLQVQMLHPLDPSVFREFARDLREIIVVEEKRPFLEVAIRDALYGGSNQPPIVGKFDEHGGELLPRYGTLDVDMLTGPLSCRLGRFLSPERLHRPDAPRQLLPMLSTSRTPYFCAGCPHSTSTKVPSGSTVGGGIGCHGIAVVMDPERVGTIATTTHMGGEGAQWIGVEPFVELDHFIQNMGDGTFFHSGQLSVQAAVSAGSNITFKLLYNSAIAMTGGQDPGASNARPVPDLAGILLRQGVAQVLITTDEPKRYRKVSLPKGVDVWNRSRIVEAQELLAKVPGVTVLIHDQQCATEKRRDRKRGLVADAAERIFINERVCEGCGDCGAKSNCLAVEPIETEFGRKTAINQSSCNKDLSCLDGDCPSFVTVVERQRRRALRKRPAAGGRRGGSRLPALDRELPDPVLRVDPDDVTIRMPGIGGTGVVTVNQILGTAALLDGRHVNGLDQTGLSQKAGPVVSDLRITAEPNAGSNKPSAGSVDVYLVFDLLVALSPSNLQGVSTERSFAVVSTSRTPTGAMVSHVDIEYPDDGAMLATLADSVQPDGLTSVDALAAAEGLFGTTMTANVFTLGVAFQLGLLPLRHEAIDSAIELNGAAVEANKLAFRWGRLWAIDPDAVQGAMSPQLQAVPTVDDAARRMAAGLDVDAALRHVVEIRVADLIGYEDEAYARRYVDRLRRAVDAERRVAPHSVAFGAAVANGLHKLMAYKDEYEVARLHLDSASRAKLAAASGPDARVYWMLQPPMLKALGLDHKVRLGPWFTPAFSVLRAGRRLRGTPFDPFGHTRIRRLERELVGEYEAVVDDLANRLDEHTLSAAANIAALPDMVRGYEQLKLDNVEKYRTELAARLAEMRPAERRSLPAD